jgi:hypothetical protein
MKTGKNDIEKLTQDLLKKGLQSPTDKHFDERLMKMILESPLPTQVRADKLLKNGWRFMLLALILLISTVGFIAYVSSGNSPVVNQFLSATRVFILYGGIALFIPLLFLQFDALLKMKFENRFSMKAGYYK